MMLMLLLMMMLLMMSLQYVVTVCTVQWSGKSEFWQDVELLQEWVK